MMPTGACDNAPLHRRVRVFLWAALLLVLGLVILRLQPPPERGQESDPGRFSSARARDHVERIARQPHFIGSREHDRVRDYLVATLRGLGLEAEIQATMAHRHFPVGGSLYLAGRVENVIARLPGSDPSRALLLCAHYDSGPASPGAGDNGAAVGALLETLRALTPCPSLRNDLVVLFSDGEEAGLLGATAFVQKHPLASRIGMVVNFDSRGTGGPSLMFEPGRDNGPMIRHLFRSLPGVVSSSLMGEVYRLLPNRTDFTAFREAGIPGLNFAFVQGLCRYHTPLDDPANLDGRTLQQVGDQALALARHFGNLPLEGLTGADRVFVGYPLLPNLAYAPWLQVAGLGVVLALLWHLVRRYSREGTLSASGLLLGSLWVPLSMLLAAALSWVCWAGLARLQGSKGMAWGDLPQGGWYTLAFSGLALAGTYWLGVRLGRRAGWNNLFSGCLLVWTLFATLAAGLAPGAGFLFVWPLLAVLLGEALILRLPAEGLGTSLLQASRLLPLILLWGPTLALLFSCLGVSGSALAVSLMAPFLALALASSGWICARTKGLMAAGLGLALTGLVAGGSRQGKGDHQAMYSLAYIQDADRATTHWLAEKAEAGKVKGATTTGMGSLDGVFPFMFLPCGGFLPAEGEPRLPSPRLMVLGEERGTERRRLSLHLIPGRNGSLALYIQAPRPLGIRLEGHPLDPAQASAPGGPTTLLVFNPPSGGVQVDIELPLGERLVGRLVEQESGLVAFPSPPPVPRPDQRRTGPLGDAVAVTRSVSL